jgi:hypothetical protein
MKDALESVTGGDADAAARAVNHLSNLPSVTRSTQSSETLPMLSAIGAMTQGVASSPDSGASLVLPRIEGYHITQWIGAGAMGTVWAAVQLGTQRTVALKLLNSAMFASEEARACFHREVELSARLEHPNVARVYDSGLDEDRYYYAMELLPGWRLDEYVRAKNFSQREILEMMRVICQAVQYAHQRGVIHRDLKPSNILITEDGQPHVVDFGLAKPSHVVSVVVGAGLDDGTNNGQVAGTPAFMSPEQAAGDGDGVDTRTDVYSLGVILFNLLTREWPHDLSGSYEQILERRQSQEARRARSVTKKVSRELDTLIAKALAREPEDRYASAGELAKDIGHYLAGEPLTARKATVFYVLSKRLHKYRLPASLAAGALLGFGIVAVLAYVQIGRERDKAQSNFFKAEFERARNNEIIEFNVAMARERDLDKLLSMIVSEARRLTNADGGSPFVCEGDKLAFRVAQNDTLMARSGPEGVRKWFLKSYMDKKSSSIAGYVALTGERVNEPDVYAINASLPYRHNPKFDQANGYRTRSVLVVPLKDPDGKVLGVLQLINCKGSTGEVTAFPQEAEGLTTMLASQAAVALRYAEGQKPATGEHE